MSDVRIMTAIDTAKSDLVRRERAVEVFHRVARVLDRIGFGWFAPVIRILAGDSAGLQLRELWQRLFVPAIGILVFLLAWAALAPQVKTSLGAIGLGDGCSRTLEEVGQQFQVTRERIRQIEAKALRKMRHPTRIRQLHGFLEITRPVPIE